MDSKLLVMLSVIVLQQAAATKNTTTAVSHFLNYIMNYPDDSVIYRASGMVLASHDDAEFNKKTWSCSHTGIHIYL